MIWRRSSAYSSMILRASSNRDNLGASLSLSGDCPSRDFILAMSARDLKGLLI